MISYSSLCPGECPASPLSHPVPCSMMTVETGSVRIRQVEQCTRCGYLDPQALDRWAERAAKETLTAVEARTAMAIEGEPFTFVRSSEADITLDEALGQALGAASMCWEGEGLQHMTFNSERAKRIFQQLKLLLQEKSKEDRAALVQEIVDNTQ